MSAQLENGYTRIADAILEKIAKTKLNGTQFRILMIVWRSTYGWNKKEYELSLGYLSEATGIHKQQIKREIDVMIEKKILVVVKKSTYTTGREIGFNKNYVGSVQSTKKSTVSENADPTVSELVYPTVSENAYQNKDINKQSNKQSIYQEIYDYYLSLNLKKHRALTDDMKKGIDKAIKELKLDVETMKKMLKRHSEKVESTKNDGQYKTKPRPLAEFFGQKKYNSVSLICSDYLDENYEEQKKEGELYSSMRWV